ncbi:MAG TPA: dihydrofolate reductase [Cyanobacteria bacterium UBA8553]|nr:dihydrofolate reductase [Cyanobacteria bacterium UBA8553]HAJ63775.1 dihydrofolate reductase [Cyanobacteria bacterium UBA8543]
MRKLKYYVACTVDGYIAHKDHTIDGFLQDGEHVTDYLESFKWFDVVVMGRKTYEFGLNLGVTNPYPSMKQYVFSRTMKESPDEHVEIVSENIVELVKALKNEPGKDIYLCGGAELATTLFTAHLIDEIILKLNPVLFGSGIPLFSEAIQQTALELTDSKIYQNGVVLLFYRVKN